MKWVDSHAHIFVEEFETDREAVMQRALEAGVNQLFMPNLDAASVDSMMAVAAAYPNQAFPMMGLHPCYVKQDHEDQLRQLERCLSTYACAAIGEIGLDFYWDTTYKAEQFKALTLQLNWAKSLGIPAVLHTREATSECIQVIQQEQDGRLKGIFHCFSGSLDEAKRILDLGFHLGIGGVLTFKKNALAEVVAALPLSSMVLETDAPYLAPVPYRGKRNESSYIPIIAEKLADIKGVSLQQVSDETCLQAELIFGSQFFKITNG